MELLTAFCETPARHDRARSLGGERGAPRLESMCMQSAKTFGAGLCVFGLVLCSQAMRHHTYLAMEVRLCVRVDVWLALFIFLSLSLSLSLTRSLSLSL